MIASSFPFDLLGVVLEPTMFEVTVGYFTSGNDFFLRERRLLVKLEVGAADNRLKTDSLLV